MNLSELLDLMYDYGQTEITFKLHLDEENEQYIVSVSKEQMQKLQRSELVQFSVDDDCFTPLRKRPDWLETEL